eukprot:2867045-Rhodomonas_salina.12
MAVPRSVLLKLAAVNRSLPVVPGSIVHYVSTIFRVGSYAISVPNIASHARRQGLSVLGIPEPALPGIHRGIYHYSTGQCIGRRCSTGDRSPIRYVSTETCTPARLVSPSTLVG